jgi:clan AA aspartic protease
MRFAQPHEMGLIHVLTVLTAIRALDDSDRTYEAPFLVDTGAMDSMARASALLQIGIKPIGQRRYQRADGTFVEYPFGLAQIEFMGETTAGRIVFGPETVEPILGVTQLESAGITIDPINQTLSRLPAISLR